MICHGDVYSQLEAEWGLQDTGLLTLSLVLYNSGPQKCDLKTSYSISLLEMQILRIHQRPGIRNSGCGEDDHDKNQLC